MKTTIANRKTAAEVIIYLLAKWFPELEIISCETDQTFFSCEFFIKKAIDEQFFPHFEREIKEFIKEGKEIKLLEMTRSNAIDMFHYYQLDDQVERLENLSDGLVSIVQIDDFFNLCKGPIVSSSNEIGVVKLLELETLPSKPFEMVRQRITGTVFDNLQSLKQFLKRYDQYKKKDHRLLGPQMGLLTSLDDDNTWIWEEKGVILKKIIKQNWEQSIQKLGFQIIQTPRVLNKSFEKGKQKALEKEWFEDSEYFYTQNLKFAHALYFKSKKRSYLDLPFKIAEWTQGISLKEYPMRKGLYHPISFECEEAHIFCNPSSVEKELISSLQFIKKIAKILDFESHYIMRLRGPKHIGSLEAWDKAERWIKTALSTLGIQYELGDKPSQEGPKLELYFKNSLGEYWLGAYLGINFRLAEQFDLQYQEKNDEMQRPIVLEISSFTVVDRIIALLIEKGIPFSLIPSQVKVVSVGVKQISYAQHVQMMLKESGLRVGVDFTDRPLQTKFIEAELEKVPYLIFVGEKEEKTKTISVRELKNNEKRIGIKIESFLEKISQEEILVEE
ncbi:Threonine--tRNA ligase 2 [Candidatus Rubidus massiliensis]|nr:Threonine--tRNA ligase 2 [Candidatus Rubidus massiliensis]